jgi:hypothetical protein
VRWVGGRVGRWVEGWVDRSERGQGWRSGWGRAGVCADRWEGDGARRENRRDGAMYGDDGVWV